MSETYATLSRRSFCAGACSVSAAAALAMVFSGCGSKDSSSSSPSAPSSSTPVNLASLNGTFNGSGVDVTAAGSPLNDVGGAALVQSIAGNFLVSRSGATAFVAIDATCTHEGCTVNGADGSLYVCPCHGSRYSRTGQVVLGPATASLRQYGTTFTNGIVTINV